jgi:hypothetical protein
MGGGRVGRRRRGSGICRGVEYGWLVMVGAELEYGVRVGGIYAPLAFPTPSRTRRAGKGHGGICWCKCGFIDGRLGRLAARSTDAYEYTSGALCHMSYSGRRSGAGSATLRRGHLCVNTAAWFACGGAAAFPLL